MNFAQLRQSGASVPAKKTPAAGRVTGIVKVRKAGYLPKKVKRRAEIDACMFTAEFNAEDLREIENDPGVETVSLAEKLPLQKLP